MENNDVWKRVADELPKEGQLVLVADHHRRVSSCAWKLCLDTQWACDAFSNEYRLLDYFAYWMPKPEMKPATALPDMEHSSLRDWPIVDLELGEALVCAPRKEQAAAQLDAIMQHRIRLAQELDLYRRAHRDLSATIEDLRLNSEQSEQQMRIMRRALDGLSNVGFVFDTLDESLTVDECLEAELAWEDWRLLRCGKHPTVKL
jgi:hypothetical protein